MKNLEFRKFLLKASFIMIACDGEISNSEIEELKMLTSKSIYFDGLDIEQELQSLLSQLKSQGQNFINEFLEQFQKIELLEKQEITLLDFLIKLIYADGKVDDNELYFLQKIKAQIKHLNDEKLIVNFPKNFNIFMKNYKILEVEVVKDFTSLKIDN